MGSDDTKRPARTYRGSGGPPPENSKGSVDGLKFFEQLPSGDQKKVSLYKMDSGEKMRPVIFLDKVVDYTVRLHAKFWYDGQWENYVPCRSGLGDSKGCPLCPVMKSIKRADGKKGGEPWEWRAVASVISQHKFIPDTGKNKGKVYTNFRQLVLIPKGSAPTFDNEAEARGDLRLNYYKVTRSTNDKAPGIGETWTFIKRADEAGVLRAVEESAERYGLSPDAYIKPFDYDAIFEQYPYEKLKALAEEIAEASSKSKDRKSDSKGGSKSHKSSGSSPVKPDDDDEEPAEATSTDATGEEEDIPF